MIKITEMSQIKKVNLELQPYLSEKLGNAPCDLLLLDIEMADMNGMELARKLRHKGDMLPIIFITGYSEFMQDGYDVEALHYLLKPVNKEKLFAVCLIDMQAVTRLTAE